MYKGAARSQQQGRRVSAFFGTATSSIVVKKKKRKQSLTYSEEFIKAAHKAKLTIEVMYIPPHKWRLRRKDRTVFVASLDEGMNAIRNWFGPRI